MNLEPNDFLNLCRKEGAAILERNLQAFQTLVARTAALAEAKRHHAAAAYAEIAALYATSNPCGLFASPEIEKILTDIGRMAIPTRSCVNRPYNGTSGPRRILHVTSAALSIGGHSAMLRRWIHQDSGRHHSVALTRQRKKIPTDLEHAVRQSGGRIYAINRRIGSLLSWAKYLRDIASQYDLIVLHVGNRDVIPILAFADKQIIPPIIYVDHADHMFWLGTSISDVVVSLRESGMRLAQLRRGIAPERNLLLPIILHPPSRTLSRSAAKQLLGLPSNSIVLLSVARSTKYKNLGPMNYIDAHIPFLERFKNSIIIIVGCGERNDWIKYSKDINSRILTYPEMAETSAFYQAADIYIDSFPFVSTTSLLEAGSYATPLVSRYPYGAKAEILGADMPGLTNSLLRVQSQEEYTMALSQLAENEERRLAAGRATREEIERHHTGARWQEYLENAYMHAMEISRYPINTHKITSNTSDCPDVLYPYVYECLPDLEMSIMSQLGIMPIDMRFRHWVELIKSRGFSEDPHRQLIKCWIPEWIIYRIVQHSPS